MPYCPRFDNRNRNKLRFNNRKCGYFAVQSVCDNCVFQKLGIVAVEAVYPGCGLYLLPGPKLARNERMRALRDGKAFQADGSWRWAFPSGSRSEGVAVRAGWGHGTADVDIMRLHGGDLGVYVLSPGQQLPEGVNLLHRPEGCAPAYSRLQVLDKEAVVKAIAKRTQKKHCSESDPVIEQCVGSESGWLWLHSRHTVEVMQHSLTKDISGPAGQKFEGLGELVLTLVC